MEVIAAIIAGGFLIANTWMARKTRKDLAMQNGEKPGWMLEAIYYKLDEHINDESRHNG